MIKITVTVDGQEYRHEVADHTHGPVIRRIVAGMLADIPQAATARSLQVKVTRSGWTGWTYDLLSRWADLWLSVNPAVRGGVYTWCTLWVAAAVAVALFGDARVALNRWIETLLGWF